MGRHPYDTDYELGEDNITKFGLDFHNPVFPLSALFSIAFITLTLIYPDAAFELLNRCKTQVIELFDSVFMLSANSFVVLLFGEHHNYINIQGIFRDQCAPYEVHRGHEFRGYLGGGQYQL
ncbi:MAG: hypothetical protein HRU21_12395, partial [Pseudomonadales bacterium]|nr:hypothetical protein [Pseudomonadales bacterium]